MSKLEVFSTLVHRLDKIDPRRNRRPLVLADGPDVRLETGPIDLIDRTDRIALIAGWTPAARQSRSLLAYVRELAAAHYVPVLINAGPDPSPLTFPGDLPAETIIFRRPNRGYDFGSWASVLAAYPQIAHIPTVLLTNDSLVGPFAPIGDLLNWVADEAQTDVVAITDSLQFAPHLQSYFLAMRGGVLADPVIAALYARIRVEPGKSEVVLRYEVELLRALQSAGFSCYAMYRSDYLGVAGKNPTLAAWFKLLNEGFPFVKRTMITDPKTAPAADSARTAVRRMYGEDINDWL